MCKFNPKNHYYFNDSLHFFKSCKIKSDPNQAFNTTYWQNFSANPYETLCITKNFMCPCYDRMCNDF